MNSKLEEFLKLVNGKTQDDSFEEDSQFPIEWKIDKVDKIGKEDKHRWYALQDTVYAISCGDEPLGLIHGKVIIQLYSENSSYGDIYHTYNFVACERTEQTVVIADYKNIN